MGLFTFQDDDDDDDDLTQGDVVCIHAGNMAMLREHVATGTAVDGSFSGDMGISKDMPKDAKASDLAFRTLKEFHPFLQVRGCNRLVDLFRTGLCME